MSKKATIDCSQYVFQSEALIQACDRELKAAVIKVNETFSGAQQIKRRLSPDIFNRLKEYEERINIELKKFDEFNRQKKRWNLQSLDEITGQLLIQDYYDQHKRIRDMIKQIITFRDVEIATFKQLILASLNRKQDSQLPSMDKVTYPDALQGAPFLIELYQFLKGKPEHKLLNQEALVALTHQTWDSLQTKAIQESLPPTELKVASADELVTNIFDKIEIQVDETVRKKTVEAVIEIIQNKGFLIDYQQIKRNPMTNQVVLVAQKVTGEVAEFFIDVQGRFTYHFDGYEGQACQTDLQPFLTDLQLIYGVKINHETTIQANPDKITQEKKQVVNVKKGGQ
jgi:hypothetical protein